MALAESGFACPTTSEPDTPPDLRPRNFIGALDKEERELLDSIEKGKWEPVHDKEAKIKRYAQYAKNTVKKIRKS